MPADAVNYGKLAEELNGLLAGGRIDKIVMGDKSTLMLMIRANGANRNLLITAAASPRCFLTERRITATDVPLAFCLHLRRHIGGGQIKRVSALPFERILRVDIASRGDLGEELERVMFVEIMGKYSNVVLTDGALRITDALKHVSLGEGRPVLPGVTYEPPSDPSRFAPVDREAADNIRRTTNEDDLPSVMMKRMLGLSAATARSYIASAPTPAGAGYSAEVSSMGLPPLSARSRLRAAARAVSAAASSAARFMRSIFILLSSSEVVSPPSYFSVNLASSSSALRRLSASISFCLLRCTRSRQSVLASSSRSRRAVRYSMRRTSPCSRPALRRAP